MKALLFTDVVDSTLLTEQLGDARAAQVWSEHDRHARDLMRAHRAREIDRTDGFFLLFDDVLDAARYALAYHAALQGLALIARAGLHVGDVILRDNTPDDMARGAKPVEVEGIAKPLANRVMALARGGQTLLSHSAQAELASRIPADTEVLNHGHFRFAGVEEPIEVFELCARSSSAGRVPPADTAKGYRVVRVDDIWRPVRDVRHNLPAERDSFIGRVRELRDIAAQCAAGARLLTLLGVGGTGKTRLACRYGAMALGDWPGGVYFCDLSEARSLDGIYFAIASALEVTLGRTDPAVQLGHAIAGRGQCLMILDNFEQVQPFARQTIGAWLDRASHASFLVTSRERLHLAGEHVLPIDPLPLANEAVELFVMRAAAQKPGFVLDADNRTPVAEIVRLLDGLPLAIELAAARSGVLPPHQLLQRLTDRFRLLGNAHHAVARQATLRATVDWSWNLLTAWEQAALAQCSVFEGGFALDAAEQVLDLSRWREAPPMLDIVQALLDKCLLRAWTPSEQSRYGIHEPYFGMYMSIHEYVREKLRAEGAPEQMAAEQRHGRYFARFGDDAALQALSRHGGAKRRLALRLELDNLIAACRRAAERGDGATALGAYLAASEVLELQGPLAASMELSSVVLALADTDPGLRAAVCIARARAAWRLGRIAEAEQAAQTALSSARHHGDRRLEGKALGFLGSLDREQSRMDAAQAHFEQALAVARETGDEAGQGIALSDLGLIHHDLMQVDPALACYQQALAIQRAIGDRRSEGVTTGNLGNLHYEQGRIDEAQAMSGEVCVIGREMGDLLMEGIATGNLGMICHERGRHAEARAHLETALKIHREGGHRRHEGIVLDVLGVLHRLDGRFAQAGAMHDQALAIAHEARNRRDEAGVRCNRGDLHRDQGSHGAAHADYAAALAIHRERSDRYAEGMLLDHIGELLRREGRLAEAVQTLTAGEALLGAVDDPHELAKLLCTHCRVLLDSGDIDAARATWAQAEQAGARVATDLASELGQRLAALRQVLAAAAPPSAANP